jgi:hypothetical protein
VNTKRILVWDPASCTDNMIDTLVFLIMSGTKYVKEMEGQVLPAVFAFHCNCIFSWLTVLTVYHSLYVVYNYVTVI